MIKNDGGIGGALPFTINKRNSYEKADKRNNGFGAGCAAVLIAKQGNE